MNHYQRRGHVTPRMHNRPDDPAHFLLKDDVVSTPKLMRSGCYICEDMEFARMGMRLCSPCCQCSDASGGKGHIPADDNVCDDCGHEQCQDCATTPPQGAPICTCDSPCCEADIGIGVITCGGQHCPTHGVTED